MREAAGQVLSEYIGGLAEGESVQDRAKAWLQKKNYIWPGDATVRHLPSFRFQSQSPFLEAKRNEVTGPLPTPSRWQGHQSGVV